MKDYELTSDKSAEANFQLFGGGVKGSRKYSGEVFENMLYNCYTFEEKLIGRDDYFDFNSNSDFDLSTISRGSIIKFDSGIIVPEKFDLTQTFHQFKDLLLDSELDKSNDVEAKALIKIFENDIFKIPIISELNSISIGGKLLSSNLVVSYEELEDYEVLEVSILGRITSPKLVDKSKAFYDPLKDFMKLNRSFRRSIDSRSEGIKEIYLENDYKTIDIIAIYQ